MRPLYLRIFDPLQLVRVLTLMNSLNQLLDIALVRTTS